MFSESRLRVGFLGAGPAARAFSVALRTAQHHIVGVADEYLREPWSELVPVVDESELFERSDLIVFDVPDDELQSTIDRLMAVQRFRAGQMLVHTSPGFGWQVFDEPYRRQSFPMAVHPAVPFTGAPSLDAQRMTGAWFAVSSPLALQPIARALVMELGGETVLVDDDDRPTYAEAIAAVRNMPHTVVARSRNLLESIGVPQPTSVIQSIARAALDEALQLGSEIEWGAVSANDGRQPHIDDSDDTERGPR